MTSLKDINRKDLAAYQRYCAWAGLQDETIDIDALVGEGDLVYRFDWFVVVINGTTRINDWLLTPRQMDRVFFYATRSNKRRAEKERNEKRSGNKDIDHFKD